MFLIRPLKTFDFAFILIVLVLNIFSVSANLTSTVAVSQTIIASDDDCIDPVDNDENVVPGPQKDELSFVVPKSKRKIVPSKQYSDYEIVMWLLKRNESLRLTPYWDVKQWTSGWGTKASHKSEALTITQANERTREVFQGKYNYITKTYPKLDKFTRLVIAEFIYNVGDNGIKGKLHAALKSGDIDRICRQLSKYVHAGGERLPGLVTRRQREIDLLKANPQRRQELAEIYKIRVNQLIQENK
jgi:GH24 family phage-related lysozyme (muramidase)